MLFGGKKKKGKNDELNQLLFSVESNLGNNYKDAARDYLKTFISRFETLKAEGKLKAADITFYSERISDLSETLTHFSHADQKPYWTKEDTEVK